MITTAKQRQRQIAGVAITVIAILFSLPGCVKYHYKPQPVDMERLAIEINSWSLHDSGLKAFLGSNGMTGAALDGEDFSIKRLYLTGLYYNPDMRTAYRKWKKAQKIAGNSDYRSNPELSVPLEHHSDTADGKSPWTIGAVLGFIYERKGKREARIADAEVQTLNARLEMEKLAIDSYAGFQKQYQEYLVSRFMLTETENEIEVFKELLDLLQKKYELGGASEFEISNLALELQQRMFELNLLKNMSQEYRDNLLAMSNLGRTEYGQIEIQYNDPLALIMEKYRASSFWATDFSTLQTAVLNTHITMALQLNIYAQAEAGLRLEIENQYPDIVLSPGFLFDQSDNIWTLGASWVLPLFGKTSQDLKIISALEERKIRQEEIIVLQKKLLDTLYQLYQSIHRHRETIKVSDEIVTAILGRASTIQKQIELGGVDRISLLRNRMEYYEAKKTQTEIYHQAVKAMLDIENLVQYMHSDFDISQVVKSWIENMEKKNIDEHPY